MRVQEESTIERIKQDWKTQTFQFDYIPHLKRKFVVGYLLFYITTWVLMGVFKHDVFFLLTQIPCLLSWNYFVFFDKKYRAYNGVINVVQSRFAQMSRQADRWGLEA